MSDSTITFAGLDAPIAPLGVGTWAWGDKNTWGMGSYDSDLTLRSIQGAWEASFDGGVSLFDTAEVYGSGTSEEIIGGLLQADPGRRGSLVLATKFLPFPWKVNVGSALASALDASLERLGTETIDLYQIHGPISLRSHSAMADALATAHEAGKVRAVGVSNYSAKEMRAVHTELAERGIPLASNQIEFSLLRRKPETGGLLAACRELDVVPLAYSPMAQGRLTGKYSGDNPPPGRRDFSAHPWEMIDPVVAELRRIGAVTDHTPAQVALNWIIAKGAVPIPGAKNADQARQNAGALGWSLSDDEVSDLDAVALEGTRSLRNRIWQHG